MPPLPLDDLPLRATAAGRIAASTLVLWTSVWLGCADETALVARIDGLPASRDGVSMCLTARRKNDVVFVAGYGVGRASPLPPGELTLTFVPDDPGPEELLLVASAWSGARAIRRGVTRASFREGRVERASVAVGACSATAAGTLRTLATREPSELPVDPVIVDVDADGNDDVAGVDAAGALVRLDVLSGRAIAGPTSDDPTDAARAVALDIDGDCVPDLALAGVELTVVPISGHDPTLSLRRLTLRATAVTAGDVDGDGRDDLVVVSGDESAVIVADSADALRRTASLATGAATHLAAGDLDGDGRSEIIATGADGTRLWQGGTMPIERSEALPPALASVDAKVELGDLDADGVPDVAGVRADGTLVLARNRGDGFLEDWTSTALRGLVLDVFVRDVAIADVTGDCLPDLVLAIEAAVPLVLRGRPDGGFEPGPTLEAVQCREVTALDADGDGHAEIGALTASGRFVVIGAAR